MKFWCPATCARDASVINGAIFIDTKFQANDQCQICPQVAGWESKSFSLKYNDEKGLKEKLKEKLGAKNGDRIWRRWS